MPDKKESPGGSRSFGVSNQLAALVGAYPGMGLTAQDVQQINAGQITVVGQGSIAPLPPGHSTNVPRGCIEFMFYNTGSEDLTFIRIDGKSYGSQPWNVNVTNLSEFREILEKAAFSMKCVGFCIRPNGEMYMLRVSPQCCCRCEEVKT